MHRDIALRVELHRRAVLRGDLRAADAVERRRRIGHLDERRKADAAIDALLAQPLLLGAQAGVVHQRVDMRERLVMRELLELDAGRRPTPDRHRPGMRLRRRISSGSMPIFIAARSTSPSVTRGRDRMADRAVLAHHVLVLEHDARAGAIVRAGVGPAGQVHDLVGLDARGARIDRIRPDAGEIVDLPRGDRAVAS